MRSRLGGFLLDGREVAALKVVWRCVRGGRGGGGCGLVD